MAWLIGDSFDFHSSATDLTLPGSVWATPLGGPSTNSRFGVGLSLAGVSMSSSAISKSVFFTNSTTVYVNFASMNSFAPYPNPGSTAQGFGVNIYDTNAFQCALVFRQQGDMVLLGGRTNVGTVIATSPVIPSLSTTIWNHFQVKLVISTTVGSIEVRLNGNNTPVFIATGLNTQNGSGNNYCNAIGFEQIFEGGYQPYVDDLYVFNDQGVAPNTWQGDVRAVQLMPNSDLSVVWSHSTGSTNWQCVDEPIENGDTDYVYTLTANNVDQYGTTSLAVTPTAIVNVVTKALVRMDDAGPHSVRTRLTSNAITSDSALLNLASTYQWLWTNYLPDPSGGAAWTTTRVNAATIGPFCVS